MNKTKNWLFYQNRGMYTETLVNKTNQWYIENKLACFLKNYLPIKLTDTSNTSYVKGNLTDKASVDYYGVYQGQYIEFEVKETNRDFFLMSQIKKHQFEHLKFVQLMGGITFLLLNFVEEEKIFVIDVIKLRQKKIRKITLEIAEKHGKELFIKFPGIIDWLIHIDLKNKKLL